jgi:DNA-binding HxlR family transcriptional regulator
VQVLKTSPAQPLPDLITINAVLIAVRQAAHVLCDRATLLVLLHAHGGTTRYADFSAQTGLASRLLSSRLSQLTEDGLLVRIPYSRRPLRHAYHLTHMGTALFDVLALLVTWERAWPGAEGLNDMAQVVHRGCKAAGGQANDAATTVRMHCAACQLAVSPRDISFRVSQTEMAKMPAKSTTTRKTSQDTAVKPGDAMTPIPQGLAVLGDKWSIEVLVCAFFGMRQFGDFGTRLGISTNILINRLERLVQEGLLRRTTDDDDTHRKGLYLLTPKGRDFYAILIAIQVWADQWIDHRVRSPVKLRHSPCQKLLQPVLTCTACGQAVTYAQGRILLPLAAPTT